MAVEHLYLHIPFCHRICPYCSFHKHQLAGFDPMAYVAALGDELRRESQQHEIRPRTLYLGGGTPSLLSEEALRLLRKTLEEHVDLDGLDEFDLEANPKTFDSAKADVFQEIGVSRVSLGVQSWNPDELKILGRDHSPDEAAEAFRVLREAGIAHLNLDLMFSVPGQTPASWRQSLNRTLELDPDHVSAYNLTYEEDTEYFERLRKGEFSESEDLNASLYELAERMLENAGFDHYEISNYGKPGQRSIHNEAYWEGRDYVGLGAGATSTVNGLRWINEPNTEAYLDASREAEPFSRQHEELDANAVQLERVALGLRRVEGIATELLQGVAGLEESLDRLEIAGLVKPPGRRIVLTRAGRQLVDPIVIELLGDV